MNKILCVIFVNLFFILPVFSFGNKKLKSSLFLSKTDPLIFDNYDTKIQQDRYFRLGDKIYFLIQNPQGFSSDYVKYQIVKQDDNAHIGGYSRVINKTVRLKNKYYFSDYFVLYQTGKYYIQIFDIIDTNHWLNIEGFAVINE